MSILRWGVCVCVERLNRRQILLPCISCSYCRGVRHDCGTALNEATTIMGYWVWSTQRTCFYKFSFSSWVVANPRTTALISSISTSSCTVVANCLDVFSDLQPAFRTSMCILVSVDNVIIILFSSLGVQALFFLKVVPRTTISYNPHRVSHPLLPFTHGSGLPSSFCHRPCWSANCTLQKPQRRVTLVLAG